MSADDTTDGSDEESEDRNGVADEATGGSSGDEPSGTSPNDPGARSRREELTDRLSEETDRAREEFDQRLVDLLSWMLDTETRARIYVHLRQSPYGTSEEIAEGTGLYPSTVREALAELHDDGVVDRRKRENEGAGNNPYEYAAIAPSELVGSVAERVQSELNTVFNLDTHLGSSSGTDRTPSDDEPVTITVEDERAADVAPEGDQAADADAASEAGESEGDEASDDEDTADESLDSADGSLDTGDEEH